MQTRFFSTLLCLCSFALLSACTKSSLPSSSNQRWQELGSGNNALNTNGEILSIAVDASGNVYALGTFFNAKIKNYVALWNGSTWKNISDVNSMPYTPDHISAIASDAAGNIYAAVHGYMGPGEVNYIAKWNGNTWDEISHVTKPVFDSNYVLTLVIDIQGNIYAAGAFTDSFGKTYVAKCNSTPWSKLGTNDNPIEKLSTDAAGNVYAIGNFLDSNRHFCVIKWDGNSWSELGDSSNALNATRPIFALVGDAAGNIYAGGAFEDAIGYSYVAKWSGGTWNETGIANNALNTGFGHPIYSLAADAKGNIYAGGTFVNSAGKICVAKWDNSGWTELGSGNNSLNANGGVFTITTDIHGNVYAAGRFTNAAGNCYVAKYSIN